jgi:hypothetical protein
LINYWVKKHLESRLPNLERAIMHPLRSQKSWFNHLVQQGARTQFGKDHGFSGIRDYYTYTQNVPIRNYETLKPWLDRSFAGEKFVLWPSEIRWFAKSSGTTDNKSKYIPVTNESLQHCHYKASRDILTFYTREFPNHKLFSGKSLILTGSTEPTGVGRIRTGDVSGVLIENLSPWIHFLRTPPKPVALIRDWEQKIEALLRIVPKEDVTFIGGVPSWMQVLIQRMMQQQNVSDLHEIWPNLSLFIHGAVNFAPYREPFARFFPSGNIHYLETYNATEGFFGMSDTVNASDMLLMPDYGIFYEFISMDGSEWGTPIPLEEVRLGVQYAVVVSTNSGLWRYMIGDTVVFTSCSPYRIRITGRTKHFINAFGEELIIDNAEQAIAYACTIAEAEVREFTAAPVYLSNQSAGRHEWLIEFERLPKDIDLFTSTLDSKLRDLNSDYDAKRKGDMTLAMLSIHILPENTFYNWMKSRGKLGGQHKVPRLYNDRTYVDEIIRLVNRL